MLEGRLSHLLSEVLNLHVAREPLRLRMRLLHLLRAVSCEALGALENLWRDQDLHGLDRLWILERCSDKILMNWRLNILSYRGFNRLLVLLWLLRLLCPRNINNVFSFDVTVRRILRVILSVLYLVRVI